MHALDRINERYGNKFTIDDINILSTVIKKGLYLEIVKDFVNRDKIIVLLKYNKIPLKLVYSQKTKRVVTVLPLDVDEYNQYSEMVPEVNTNISSGKNYEEKALCIMKQFETKLGNREFNRGFNLENAIKSGIKFYVRIIEERFVILWFKTHNDKVSYQLYSKKALQKRLWHFVIQGFREQDTPLFKNTVLLYAKIYK